MLIQFSVENHLSIATRQTISLVASSLKDEATALIQTPALPDTQLLPAIVIYGANASGKSNILAALRFMIDTVRESHASGKPGEALGRIPFSLDEVIGARPSSYELDFIFEEVRYNYGFKINDETVLSEWLYSFPNNRQLKLFERTQSDFEFGRTLKGRNKVISELTRTNSLFLSAAAQNSHELLSKISLFIQTIYGDQRISVSPYDIQFSAPNIESQRVAKFLEEIGTGVADIRQNEETYTEMQMEIQREFISALRSVAQKHLKSEASLDISGDDFTPPKSVLVELGHKATDGKIIYFSLERESAGTRRLLALLTPIFRALDQGSVLVVDELNASLHTKAAEMILAMFCNPITNPRGAQLVATTHDTNLLRSSFLRRDQIWFAEKDEMGSSHIYPLTDIRTRKADNIEVGYLQGRYGAMPFTGDVLELLRQ